ncbi:MAG: PH domain-containing protein [Candidatus Micrarchaeota archaeon]
MPPRYLDPKVKWVWLIPPYTALFIIWLVVSIAVFLMVADNFVFGMEKPAFSISLFLVLLFFIGGPVYIYIHIDYMSFTYELAEHEFVIRQGLLTRHTTVIPYNRIQNVNTKRTLLERILGLASLQIETAGTNPSESEGLLPGVSRKDALVAEILQRVERVKKSMLATGAKEKTERQLLSEILKELSQLNHNLQHSYRVMGKTVAPPKIPKGE